VIHFLNNLREKLYNILKIKKSTNYRFYKGSLNLYNQFLWNFLFLGRLYYRFIGGTIFFNKRFQEKYYDLNNNNLNFKVLFDKFKNEGCIVIPNYFSESQINDFKKDYYNEIENIKKNCLIPEARHSLEILKLKDSLIKILLDKNLIALIKNFSSEMVYARNYPFMAFSSNFSNNLPTKYKYEISKFADDWHIDHANLFNVHVLLEDVEKDGLCMEYIPGSHKFLNAPYLYSDEEIKTIKVSQIKKCYGKKGTAYIHYGNTLHRMFPVKNSNRLQLHFEFSSKTNILFDCSNVAYTLSENYNLNKLDKISRKILSGIFPITNFKGYNILKKNSFNLSNNKIT
jgi:hypothetical protein